MVPVLFRHSARPKLGYRRNTRDFNRLIWQNASPLWQFADSTYDLSAAAFDNPDHAEIVVHNYRWRQSLAPGEAPYDADEQRLAGRPRSQRPPSPSAAISTARPRTAPATASSTPGRTNIGILDGIGHNVPQEAPPSSPPRWSTSAGCEGRFSVVPLCDNRGMPPPTTPFAEHVPSVRRLEVLFDEMGRLTGQRKRDRWPVGGDHRRNRRRQAQPTATHCGVPRDAGRWRRWWRWKTGVSPRRAGHHGGRGAPAWRTFRSVRRACGRGGCPWIRSG